MVQKVIYTTHFSSSRYQGDAVFGSLFGPHGNVFDISRFVSIKCQVIGKVYLNYQNKRNQLVKRYLKFWSLTI